MTFVVKVFGRYLRNALQCMQLNTDGKTFTSQQFTYLQIVHKGEDQQ